MMSERASSLCVLDATSKSIYTCSGEYFPSSFVTAQGSAATKVDEPVAMFLLRVGTLEAVGVVPIADGDPIIHKIFSHSKCTRIDHGIQRVAVYRKSLSVCT